MMAKNSKIVVENMSKFDDFLFEPEEKAWEYAKVFAFVVDKTNKILIFCINDMTT